MFKTLLTLRITTISSCHSNAELFLGVKGKGVENGLRHVNTPLSIHEVWQPPPLGYIKINVDVSFVESICAASVGFVARNSAGDIIISSWDYIGLCTGVDEAELRACLTGLYIGITLHKPIILETGCSFVVSLLAHANLNRSSLVDLKKEDLAITKLLPNFKPAEINRKANVVARQIAK